MKRIDYRNQGLYDGSEDYLELLHEINNITGDDPHIRLDVSNNHMRTEAIREVLKNVLENEDARNRVLSIDISNNRFGPQILPIIKCIVETCPNLEALRFGTSFLSMAHIKDFINSIDEERKSILYPDIKII